MSTKLVVTNAAALRAKYGAQGAARINTALKGLVHADRARQVQTRIVAIDSARAMKAVKGKAVADPHDAEAAKAAVDAVVRAHRPDYLMLLGGVDIIPHQPLVNPMFEPGADDDELVPSDLPYACEGEYSTEIADFVGPTRVVGRLPDITGASSTARDVGHLAGLLDRAAAAVPRPASEYTDFLGISAEAWRASTDLSLMTMFGEHAVGRCVPPEGPAWGSEALGARVHFINCHGAAADPNFYGQPASGASEFPEALRAADLPGALREGTIIAPECCYGAELYDPAMTTHPPMVNTALGAGACAYFGSSSIAYGPADGNDLADLITRYFIQQALAGASTGRAGLTARQRFVQQGSPLNPVELKTLAQFNLFGDPSVHPVQGFDSAPSTNGASVPKALASLPARALAGGNQTDAARSLRRATLLDTGLRLGASVASARGRGASMAGARRRRMGAVAAQLGLDPSSFRSYSLRSPLGPVYRSAKVKSALPDEVCIALEGRRSDTLKRAEIRAMIALVRAGEIVSVKIAYSR